MDVVSDRCWRVDSLSGDNTIVMERFDLNGELVDTGETPIEFGVWGLTADEVATVERGQDRELGVRSGTSRRRRRRRKRSGRPQ